VECPYFSCHCGGEFKEKWREGGRPPTWSFRGRREAIGVELRKEEGGRWWERGGQRRWRRNGGRECDAPGF
jgi:hypothetical protein